MELLDDCTLLYMARYTYEDVVRHAEENDLSKDAFDIVQGMEDWLFAPSSFSLFPLLRPRADWPRMTTHTTVS
jgi:hypothetical protein